MNNVLDFIRRTRKPRRPSRRPRWHLVVALAVLVVGVSTVTWGAARLAHAPQLRVRAIEIAGTARIPAYEVRQAVAEIQGAPILLLSLDGVRARVEAVPGVRSAVVARRMPDLLEVRVIERQAVARARLSGIPLLVDREGAVFSPRAGLAGDDTLPELLGLETSGASAQLAPVDRAALRALEALVDVTGRRPPVGTTVDLTPENRVVLRPGEDAPLLWLDRDEPALNLESLYEWKSLVAEIAPDRTVDLRFPRRLTLLPAPEEDVLAPADEETTTRR